MIKFIIDHSREGDTTIHQIECEEVFTSSWELKPGEKRYRILSKLFLDKNKQYPIYYSWAVHDSEALALNVAAGDIRRGMERDESKGGAKFEEQKLIDKVGAVVVKKMEK